MFSSVQGSPIRGKEVFRRMVRETTLSANDLIYPMFSAFGSGIRKEVSSMPGIFQQSIEHIVAEAKEVHGLGIPAVILFGIPETKDAVGSDAYAEHGIIQETIRAIKRELPGLAVLPMSVCVNTPTMATAASSKMVMSTTMPRSNCWPGKPFPTPRPVPTW